MHARSAPAATRRPARPNQGQTLFITATLIPMLLIFLVFWLYPLFDGIWGSLTQWQGFNPDRPFIGLENYRTLANDQVFITSLKNTFWFTILYLPTNIVLALLLALAIEATGVLRTWFRTIYFLPVVTSVIATALIWKWLYQPQLGLFNQIFELLGLPTQRFLLSSTQALPSIVVYTIWKDVGFTMVLFMAGLKGIDRTYYEAAFVDGASRWQTFWQITLPLLRPTFVFVLITGMINTLQIFGPIFVLSGAQANSPPGGPSNSTMVVPVYQWLTAFTQLNLGYGAAMSIVLFVIILLITLAQSGLLRNQDF